VADLEFDIKELSERSGATPRTVHFYVQQGLLPPAGSPGPGARYGEGHVSRLKLIRLLQKQHLPLAEIARRLKGLTDEQVQGLLHETKARRANESGSALDYIRNILGDQSVRRSARPGLS
jgi:DNA-binding transcriptional MerR regulator